jgi:prepilin-type N-terminal cleavage/methylation domain-containing protein
LRLEVHRDKDRVSKKNIDKILKFNTIRRVKMNKKGVTLIEVIVVLVIIAIGATLAVPNIGAWLHNYRLRTATRDIVSAMRAAQMKAVSTNLGHRVQFNDEGGSYIVQRMTTTGVWVNEGVLQTIPDGIRFHEINLADNRAVFNPNSTSSTGSVVLRNKRDTEKRIVLFAATGRIRVE